MEQLLPQDACSRAALRWPGEWTISDSFRAELRRLLACAEQFGALAHYGYPVERTIGICPERGLYSEAVLPDERVLRAAAMIVRHVHLQQSRINFLKVCNGLKAATVEERFRRAVDDAKAQYKRVLAKELNGAFGGLRTKGDLVKAYFYGEYFHVDDDAQVEVVEQLRTHGWGPLYKQDFAQALTEIYGCILALKPVVQNALGVDLLAPCPTAKSVQQILVAAGVGPAAIDLHDVANCKTDPPIVACRCDLGLALSSAQVDGLFAPVLRHLLEGKPGYRRYSVAWRAADRGGEYTWAEVDVGQPAAVAT